MSFIHTNKRFFGLFLVLSLLVAICELDHFFCKIDQEAIFEVEHTVHHICQNHHCSDSEENHAMHARHYNCCDNEEPHEHPVKTPAANTGYFDLTDFDIVAATMPKISENTGVLFESRIEKVSQRPEETYELLLCNDTIVLTI